MRFPPAIPTASRFIALLLSIGICFTPSFASALPPVHHFTHSEIPSDELIETWKRRLPPESVVELRTHQPTAQLSKLGAIQQVRQWIIHVGPDLKQINLPHWQDLARAGELVLIIERADVPDEAMIHALNTIAPHRILLRLTAVPATSDAARIHLLNPEVEIVFTRGTYPQYVEKQNLMQIPSHIAMTHQAESWPKFSHMDAMNMLPHPQRIRAINASFPTIEEMGNLNRITHLSEIEFLSTKRSPNGNWCTFGDLHVTWKAQGFVPDESEIHSFETCSIASRHLIVSTEKPLSVEELRRLSELHIPVTLISPAPR